MPHEREKSGGGWIRIVNRFQRISKRREYICDFRRGRARGGIVFTRPALDVVIKSADVFALYCIEFDLFFTG